MLSLLGGKVVYDSKWGVVHHHLVAFSPHVKDQWDQVVWPHHLSGMWDTVKSIVTLTQEAGHHPPWVLPMEAQAILLGGVDNELSEYQSLLFPQRRHTSACPEAIERILITNYQKSRSPVPTTAARFDIPRGH
jgi:hypothetical protein